MLKRLLILMLCLPSLALAYPDALGFAVLKMAWPTPAYKKCDYRISPQGDGSNLIKIKMIGESRISFLDDKEVWIEAVITLDRQGSIANVKWGDQKGFAPPGITNLALIQSAFAK